MQADWYVDMVFSGLDPAMTYDITTTMDRGVSTNTNRWTKISISDADAFTYAASAGSVEDQRFGREHQLV